MVVLLGDSGLRPVDNVARRLTASELAAREGLPAADHVECRPRPPEPHSQIGAPPATLYGVYADDAPVDLARKMGAPVVIAVDPSQGAGAVSITNGLQAVMRAMEICHLVHAHLRTESADLVLRPEFREFIDVLDFDARRDCVAAGIRAVRAHRNELARIL